MLKNSRQLSPLWHHKWHWNDRQNTAGWQQIDCTSLVDVSLTVGRVQTFTITIIILQNWISANTISIWYNTFITYFVMRSGTKDVSSDIAGVQQQNGMTVIGVFICESLDVVWYNSIFVFWLLLDCDPISILNQGNSDWHSITSKHI